MYYLEWLHFKKLFIATDSHAFSINIHIGKLNAVCAVAIHTLTRWHWAYYSGLGRETWTMLAE